MFVKVLGFADLLSALIVALLHHDIIGWRIGLIPVIYLAAKGWAFRSDWNSYVDFACAAYIFLMLFGIHTVFAYIVAIYLLQKAVFSLV